MSFEIIATPIFKRDIKKLAKKYRSLKSEFAILLSGLEDNPKMGISLGNNCFKIRLSIASKGKGKSGGGRIITNVMVQDKTIYLLTIYDKSEKENISDKELEDLINQIDG